MIALVLCLVAFDRPVHADTAYITDSFEVTMRTGPSTEHKIVAMLSSGDAVEVLESREGWSLVRQSKKSIAREGWVLSRYLIRREPWETRARAALSEADELKKKLNRLEAELRDALSKSGRLELDLKKTGEELDRLKAEHQELLAGSSTYLALKRTHDALQKELDRTTAQLKKTQHEHMLLVAAKRNMWFLSGALVLLFGLLLGFGMGRAQKKQRSTLRL